MVIERSLVKWEQSVLRRARKLSAIARKSAKSHWLMKSGRSEVLGKG